jgi:hypothetical protein
MCGPNSGNANYCKKGWLSCAFMVSWNVFKMTCAEKLVIFWEVCDEIISDSKHKYASFTKFPETNKFVRNRGFLYLLWSIPGWCTWWHHHQGGQFCHHILQASNISTQKILIPFITMTCENHSGRSSKTHQRQRCNSSKVAHINMVTFSN